MYHFRSTAHHTYVNTSQFNSQIEQTISASQSNNSNVGAQSSSSSPHSVSSAPPAVGFTSASLVTSSGGEVNKYDTVDSGTFKIKSSLSKRDQSPHRTKSYSHRASKLQKAASFDSRPTYATINIEPQRLYNYSTNPSHSGQDSPRVSKSSSGHVIYSSHMGYTPFGVGGPLHSSRSDHQVMLYENYASSGSPRDSSPHSVRSTTSSSQSIHSINQSHRTSSPLVASR